MSLSPKWVNLIRNLILSFLNWIAYVKIHSIIHLILMAVVLVLHFCKPIKVAPLFQKTKRRETRGSLLCNLCFYSMVRWRPVIQLWDSNSWVNRFFCGMKSKTSVAQNQLDIRIQDSIKMYHLAFWIVKSRMIFWRRFCEVVCVWCPQLPGYNFI